MADVRIVPDVAMEAAQAYAEASEYLNEVGQGLKVIQGMIDGGALVGKGGQKLADLIQNGITPFNQQISDKLMEISGDISAALSSLQESDDTAAGYYS